MNLRTIVAYAAMCTIWGTTWLAIKIGLRDVPPVTGAGIRFVIAALFLWGLARAIRAPRGTRAPWPTILILALTLFGANYALTYYAETGVASGLVAVLFGTYPFWLFGLAALLLRERPGPRAAIGAVLAFGGVAAISLGGDTHGSWPYILAALGAAIISAIGSIELKRHAATDPFRTLPPAMLVAGVAMLLAGFVFEHPDLRRATGPSSIGAILYLAILGSGVAFWLNQWLLQRLETWVVGLSTLIFPVIAVAVGALAGGEAFGPRDLIGAALVLAGVWLALSAPSPRTAPADLTAPDVP